MSNMDTFLITATATVCGLHFAYNAMVRYVEREREAEKKAAIRKAERYEEFLKEYEIFREEFHAE